MIELIAHAPNFANAW